MTKTVKIEGDSNSDNMSFLVWQRNSILDPFIISLKYVLHNHRGQESG